MERYINKDERGIIVTDHETYDVAIVGYGPVGVTAANLLGQLGLSVVGSRVRRRNHCLCTGTAGADEVKRPSLTRRRR